MDFQKWWSQHGHGMWRDEKALASQVSRAAWDAATNAERERCAKLCEEIEAKARAHDTFSRSDIEFGKAAAAEACAEAIRAS